jgi:hypothetical protein
LPNKLSAVTFQILPLWLPHRRESAVALALVVVVAYLFVIPEGNLLLLSPW